MLSMNALPVLDMSTIDARLEAPDWGKASGNLEDARVTVDALRALVHDAVFLDEDAYAGAMHMSAYHSRLQAAHAQIKGLEQEVAALRTEVARKDAELQAMGQLQAETDEKVSELKSELDNNAVVFRMHYQEIMMRTQEAERLKTVIEGLQPGTFASDSVQDQQ